MRITRFARVFIAFIIAAIVGLTIMSHKDALFPQDHASSVVTAAVPKVTSPPTTLTRAELLRSPHREIRLAAAHMRPVALDVSPAWLTYGIKEN